MRFICLTVLFIVAGFTFAIAPQRPPIVSDNESVRLANGNPSRISTQTITRSSHWGQRDIRDEEPSVPRRFFKRSDHELEFQNSKTLSLESSPPPIPQRRKKNRFEITGTLENRPELPPRVGKKCHEYPNCRFKIDRPFDTSHDSHQTPYGSQPDILADAYLKFIEKDGNKTQVDTDSSSGSDRPGIRLSSSIDHDEGFSERPHTGPSSVISNGSSLYMDTEVGVSLNEGSFSESPKSVNKNSVFEEKIYQDDLEDLDDLDDSDIMESSQNIQESNEGRFSKWLTKSERTLASKGSQGSTTETSKVGQGNLRATSQLDDVIDPDKLETHTMPEHKSVTFNDTPDVFPLIRLPKTLESHTIMQSDSESSATTFPPREHPFEYPSFFDLYEPQRDPHARIIFSDIATAWRPVEGIFTDEEQTAMFLSRSQMDGSFAFGVADGFCDEKGINTYLPQIPQDLTKISKEIYQYSRSSLSAAGLVDKAYRRILTHEERVPACISLAFGILDRYGKLSVSAMGRSGAILFRDGSVINETQTTHYDEGQPYIMVPDMRDRIAGSSNPRYVFDMFTEKSDHVWETTSGDYALFYTGEVKNHLKLTDIPTILEKNPTATARDFAEALAAKVVRAIKRKQSLKWRGQLFACLSKVEHSDCNASTDISLAVVKIK